MADRCFHISDGTGGTIRVRAGKRPAKRMEKALQELFRAARAKLAAQERKRG